MKLLSCRLRHNILLYLNSIQILHFLLGLTDSRGTLLRGLKRLVARYRLQPLHIIFFAQLTFPFAFGSKKETRVFGDQGGN